MLHYNLCKFKDSMRWCLSCLSSSLILLAMEQQHRQGQQGLCRCWCHCCPARHNSALPALGWNKGSISSTSCNQDGLSKGVTFLFMGIFSYSVPLSCAASWKLLGLPCHRQKSHCLWGHLAVECRVGRTTLYKYLPPYPWQAADGSLKRVS